MPKTLKDEDLIKATPVAPEPPDDPTIFSRSIMTVRRDSWRHGWAEGYRWCLLQSSEGLHEKKDHCAGLAAVGNDTGRSTTEAASDVVTVSREAAEDALQYAWNAGVAGAWKCVREMFADGRDVRGWAISVEKHSAPVAANWQQARDLLFGSASSSPSEASGGYAQERSAEKP
jgi:hypothetical protein